jgi:hypothetical protein
MKYFPDPFDYIIGFHCQNLNEGKRLNGNSALGIQSSGYSASKFRGMESPKIDNLSSSKLGARDKKSVKNSTFEGTQVNNFTQSIYGRNSMVSHHASGSNQGQTPSRPYINTNEDSSQTRDSKYDQVAA